MDYESNSEFNLAMADPKQENAYHVRWQTQGRISLVDATIAMNRGMPGETVINSRSQHLKWCCRTRTTRRNTGWSENS